MLDAAGCFSDIPDVINAVLYLTEGNYKEAAFSAISLIPFGDAISKGRKVALNAIPEVIEFAGKHGDEAVELVLKKGGKTTGTYGELVSSGQKDAHHIIQDAAMRDIPGYSRMDAPAIQLNGPSNVVGTEHYFATITQRRSVGGTYGAERGIAYLSLRKAELSIDEAKTAVRNADNYFMGKLGLSLDTPTRIPGNRRK